MFNLDTIYTSHWGNTYHVTMDGVSFVVRFCQDIEHTMGVGLHSHGQSSVSMHWESTIGNPRSARYGKKARHCKHLRAGDKRLPILIEKTLRALEAGEGKVL